MTQQAQYLSKYSLAHGGLVAALWIVLCPALPAAAQTRTPTSPLDRPEPAVPETRDVPAVETPTTAAPERTRPELRVTLPSTARVRVTEPVALEALLPEGVSTTNGLTPDAVVARTAERSLAVRRASARTDASDAAVRLARRGFLPRANASFRYTRLSDYTPGSIRSFDTAACLANQADCIANPDGYFQDVVLQEPILDQYALNASITVPLSDYLGASRHELRAARIDREASEESERATTDDSVLVGLETYFEVVRARAQLVLAEDAAGASEQRAVDARARRTNGLATDAAVLEAEATSQSYARLRTVAQSRVVIAERALRDLLELSDDEPITLSVALADLPVSDERDPDALRAIAQENDPNARASLLRAEAQHARADAERARMFPSLSVGFNYQYANPNQRIFPQTTTFTGTWDFGAQLAFSLDGTLLADARRSQRRALAAESELAAEDDARRAGRAVLDARAQLDASLAEVEARRLAAAAADVRDRDVAARLRVGLATDTDVLDASAGALRARLDLVDAVVNAHLARARLTRALGASAAAR